MLPKASRADGFKEDDLGACRCPIDVKRDDWVAAVGLIASEIDYSNFKDAVKERQGAERAHIYTNVWTALYELQRR